MVERRSLGEAMLTPDKLAFIHTGPPPETPKVKAKPATTPDFETDKVPEAPLVKNTERSEVEPRRSGRRAARHSPVQPMAAYPEYQGLVNLLVPLTTRLQPATAAALRRAGLEQRLRGHLPATVQEIAEEAIATWLKDAGYLT